VEWPREMGHQEPKHVTGSDVSRPHYSASARSSRCGARTRALAVVAFRALTPHLPPCHASCSFRGWIPSSRRPWLFRQVRRYRPAKRRDHRRTGDDVVPWTRAVVRSWSWAPLATGGKRRGEAVTGATNSSHALWLAGGYRPTVVTPLSVGHREDVSRSPGSDRSCPRTTKNNGAGDVIV
jgi:hypothetical protein